ncbi:MAG: hypothetical protein ACOX61_10485 [Brooklawnia sp.]|jgi:hypothetical protein
MSGFWEWLTKRFRDEGGEGMDAGWLPGSDEPGEVRHGQCYVEVRLIDSSIRYSKDRFRDQEPVVQSMVRFRVASESVPISTTVGPESLTPLGDSEFRHLEQSNIDLTGLVPFNQGDVEILAGLLTLPGRSDLTAVTGFLGKLSELVKVPHLSTVTKTATALAEGITALLGGDKTRGLIGIYLGLGERDIRRDGYYLAIQRKAGESVDFNRLGVRNDRLVVYRDDTRSGTPGSMEAWSYMLLRVRAFDDIGAAWRGIPALEEPFMKAVEAYLSAKDADDISEARALATAATVASLGSHDLSINDRDRVADEMGRRWQEAIERRKALLELGQQADVSVDELRRATTVEIEELLGEAGTREVVKALGDQLTPWEASGLDLASELDDLRQQLSAVRRGGSQHQ